MKAGWTNTTLGDIAEVVSGATPKTSVADYWDGEIPWATPKDLSELDGHTISHTPRTLSPSGLRSCGAQLLPAHSVLLSSRAPIGHVAINTVPMATNQGFKSLVPDRERVEPKFLYWWLRHHRPVLESLGNGATFKEISKRTTAGVPIQLPPLAEQRRIAAILDAADGLRAKRREALTKLDTLAQAIFTDMFGDPARNDLGWKVFPFNEVCPTHLGKMLDQKQQTGLHPKRYLRNANVRWFSFDLSDVAVMDFDEAAQEKYRLHPGDVLICEGGEPGRAAVWRGEIAECYFQKALHRGRPQPEVATSDYIVHLLRALAERGRLVDSVSKATISHLTGQKLKQLPVPLPPVALQREFQNRVGSVSHAKSQFQASQHELAELTGSLQQRAFAGEL